MQWYYQVVVGLLIIAIIGLFFQKDTPNQEADSLVDNFGEQCWGASKMKGRRSYMEDTFSYLIEDHFQLFGVYDGHGNDVSISQFSAV